MVIDRRWLALLAGAVSVFALECRADVQFTPAVSVGAARTDNVALASENEQSETVYLLTPEFQLTQQSLRTSAQADYRFEGYRYDSRSETEGFHVFNGQFRGELQRDRFFMDLSAVNNQAISDPTGVIPTSRLPITNNRVDRSELYAGPAFDYPIGNNISAQGMYRRGLVRFDDDLLTGGVFSRDYDSDQVSFQFDNYRRERGMTWALRYDGYKTDYGIFLPWEQRRAGLELGFWSGDGLRLFAGGGKESSWDDPFDPSLEDRFWEVGIAKTLGQRFSAEFAAGERTFGSSRRGSVDYTFRRGTTRFSYSEQPMTQDQNPFRGGGNIPEEYLDFLARPGNAERYISRRMQWDVTIDTPRTAYSGVIYAESREDRSRIDGMLLDDQEQKGLVFDMQRRLGSKTALLLGARRLRRELAPGDERSFTTALIGATYRPGSRTLISFIYDYIEEDADIEGQIYQTNILAVLFTRTFRTR